MNCIDANNLKFDKDLSGMSMCKGSDSVIKELCRVKDGVFELRLNQLHVYVDSVEEHLGRKIGKIKEVHTSIEELTQGDSIIFDEYHIFNQHI